MIQLNAMAGAAALLALSVLPPAGAAQPLREYRALALSGAGDRIVALESSDPGGLPLRPHASVVVRDAASGAVLHDYDPCPGCAYNCPNWSPDGATLALLATPGARKLAGAVETGVRLVGDVRRRTLAWFARYLAPVSR